MISDLVLHERTRQAIEEFAANPGHSLLLIGAEGSGKAAIAQAVVAEILGIQPKKLRSYPYFLLVQSDKNSISIESIRQLQDFVRLKTTGSQTLRRAIIVEDAHKLTTEAQNAFLKLLEEPPADTVIVLTAQGNDSLLPTITSRAPKIAIKTPPQKRATDHFTEQGFSQTEVTKAYFISRGQAGLLHALLQKNSDDEKLQYIDEAKQFLQSKSFERLVFVDQFTKKKRDVAQFLWALQRVSDAALHGAAQKNNDKQVQHWQKSLAAIIEAQDSLKANPQAKLLLTNLSLQC